VTLEDLATALDERAVSVTIWHPHASGKWVVWLFPADDPVVGPFVGEGTELEAAVEDALSLWDGAEPATAESN